MKRNVIISGDFSITEVTNEKNAAADDATAKASAYDAIMKAYQQNSASAAINAALS